MIEACVLAAGRGSRMGGAKHLLALDGVPLLERVLRALAGTSAARVSVVLAPGDAAGRELAEHIGVEFVFADNVDEGRAASVRAAIRGASAGARGLLVALADQPFLCSADFEALLAEFARSPRGIVRASYAGEPGSPVLFAREYFAELLALRGRLGGRDVVARHAADLRAVELPPLRGRDIDRPEDLPGH